MKVRFDVEMKLIKGLNAIRDEHKKRGATLPKSYKYDTPRCTHYVSLIKERNQDILYFHTVHYDGSVSWNKSILLVPCVHHLDPLVFGSNHA